MLGATLVVWDASQKDEGGGIVDNDAQIYMTLLFLPLVVGAVACRCNVVLSSRYLRRYVRGNTVSRVFGRVYV